MLPLKIWEIRGAASESTVIVTMTLGFGAIGLYGIYVIWFLYKIYRVIRNRDDLQSYFRELVVYCMQEVLMILPSFVVSHWLRSDFMQRANYSGD